MTRTMLAFLVLVGCVPTRSTLHHPGPVQRATPLHEAALQQLQVGAGLREVYNLLRACGVSHLNNPLHSFIERAPASPSASRPGIYAITGDHLRSLLLFEDGHYTRRLPLDDRVFPRVQGLRLWDEAGDAKLGFMVLSSELALGQRGSLELRVGDGPVERYDLTALVLLHDGLRDPLFIGRDLGVQDGLDLGIYFTARDDHGKPWDAAYLIMRRDGALSIQRATAAQRAKAELCSCHADWLAGIDRYPFAG